MAEYQVRPLAEKEYQMWDELVSSSSLGTVFHQAFWLGASGEEFTIYGCFRESELVGGLPVAHKTKWGLRYTFCPALTPYLGTVFKENKSKYVSKLSREKEIGRALAKEIKKDFHLLNFNFSPFFTDLQPFIWENFTAGVRYTYLLALDDPERAWNEVDAKRRNDITKAVRDGLEVEQVSDFSLFFFLVEKTFTRQEKTATFRDAAFRYNAALEKAGRCRSFVTRNARGEAIAGVYIIWDEKRSYYLLGGYDPECSHHGGSALAMWEAIKFTKNELGLKEFDFEGSMVPQIEQFFRKFGGQLTPYYTVSWTRPGVDILQDCLKTFRDAKKFVKELFSGQRKQQ